MQYYKHYKGNVYRLIAEARHSETLEEMVVYEAMYGNHDIWVRPKKMFFENVTLSDGQKVPRFAPCNEPTSTLPDISQAVDVLLKHFKDKGYVAEDFSGGCSLCGERNDFALDIIDMRLNDLIPDIESSKREAVALQIYNEIHRRMEAEEF